MDDSFTKEMLDRVVVNNSWVEASSTLGVDVLNLGRSDHLPILLNTNDNSNQGPWMRRIFRYEAKWVEEEDGKEPVQKAWDLQVEEPNF